MSSSAPIEVKVVYDATSRGRSSRIVSSSRHRNRPIALIVLGLLNLTAAGVAYYGTWWKADPFIYMKFMLHMPLAGVTLSDVDQAFAQAAGAPPVEAGAPPAERTAITPDGKFRGETLAIVLGTTAYTWLTLATVTACALALSAGSLFGRAGESGLHRVGFVLLILLVAILGLGALRVWMEYGREFPVRTLRLGMSGVVAVAFAIGMMMASRTLALIRLAAALTILLGAGTVAALHYGYRCDAIPPEHVKPMFLGLVFLAVSAWGWLLFPVGSRLAR